MPSSIFCCSAYFQHWTELSVSALTSLQAGDLEASLKQLQEQIRKDASNPKLRVFLFQLLSVLGHWERALNQLNVAGELDAGNLPMVQAYREAIRCEVLRHKVFRAETTPIVFGEPQQWQALLLETLKLLVSGKGEAAAKLKEQAYELAPSVPGTINGEQFNWLADTDSRLGPILELIVNGKYFWVPCANVKSITFEAPADLRDLVWLPAQVVWANGGNSVAFMPARYPGSELSSDAGIRLGRKTEWIDAGNGHNLGLGQKVFATDTQDYALLEIREMTFTPD